MASFDVVSRIDFQEIDNAIELIGSIPDAYRQGINLALKTKNKNNLVFRKQKIKKMKT